MMRDQEICKFKAEDHSLHHQVLSTKDIQDILKLVAACLSHFHASHCAHLSINLQVATYALVVCCCIKEQATTDSNSTLPYRAARLANKQPHIHALPF